MELAKRLGKRDTEEQLDEGEQRRRKIDEDLYSVPEHLQVNMIFVKDVSERNRYYTLHLTHVSLLSSPQSVQQEFTLGGTMTGIK